MHDFRTAVLDIIKSEMMIAQYFSKFRYLIYGGIATLLMVNPAKAAETINLVFGPATQSVSVQSLETFAETGTVDSDLRVYMNLAKVTEAEKQRFRAALTELISVKNPDLLFRLFSTDEGQRLLNIFSRIINIQGGEQGKNAL
jgi:hypothetical protein